MTDEQINESMAKDPAAYQGQTMKSSWPDWPYLRQSIIDAIGRDENLSLKHEAMFQDVVKLIDHLVERFGVPNGSSKIEGIVTQTSKIT